MKKAKTFSHTHKLGGKEDGNKDSQPQQSNGLTKGKPQGQRTGKGSTQQKQAEQRKEKGARRPWQAEEQRRKAEQATKQKHSRETT